SKRDRAGGIGVGRVGGQWVWMGSGDGGGRGCRRRSRGAHLLAHAPRVLAVLAIESRRRVFGRKLRHLCTPDIRFVTRREWDDHGALRGPAMKRTLGQGRIEMAIERLARLPRRPIIAGALSGVVSGIALGAFTGPIGVVFGMWLGVGVGLVSGYVLAREDETQSARTQELDTI